MLISYSYREESKPEATQMYKYIIAPGGMQDSLAESLIVTVRESAARRD